MGVLHRENVCTIGQIFQIGLQASLNASDIQLFQMYGRVPPDGIRDVNRRRLAMDAKQNLTTDWQDSVNFLLGLGLFLSPWALGYEIGRQCRAERTHRRRHHRRNGPRGSVCLPHLGGMDQRRFGCLANRRTMGIELQRQLGGDAYSRVDRHRRTCACVMVGSRARFRPFECRTLADEGRHPRSPKLDSLDRETGARDPSRCSGF